MWNNNQNIGTTQSSKHLEPRHSSPYQVFETLSEWGFTRPVSTIDFDLTQSSSSSSSSETFVSARQSPIVKGQNIPYFPTDFSSSSSSLSSSSSPTNFNNVNYAPRSRGIRRQEQVEVEPEPVENLFDYYDNNPTAAAMIQYPQFLKKHFGKNYGRPQVIPTRRVRNEIAQRFWGRQDLRDDVIFSSFSKASPSPIRNRKSS